MPAEQKHLAPARRPAHLDMRRRARDAGQDEDALRNMLWLINAHDRLLVFRQIAAIMLRIAQSAAQTDPLSHRAGT